MVLGLVGGLVANAIVGLLVLYLVDFLGLVEIDFNLVSVAVTAILGLLGAGLVIVLTLVDVL